MPETPPQPDSVYLVTAAGNPNLGDDIIVRDWIDRLVESDPTVTLYVDCPSPGNAESIHGPRHNVRFVDHFWRVVRGAPSHDLDEFETWLRQVSDRPDPFFPLQLADRALAGSRAVVFVGGGYIAAPWPRRSILFRLGQRAKERFGLRVIASALGPHPLAPGQESHVATSLACFDSLQVRDEHSLTNLERILPGRAVLVHDDVWASPVTRRGDDEHVDALELSIQRDLLAPEQKPLVLDRLAELATAFRARFPDGEIRVLELLPGDGWFVDPLGDQLGPIRFCGFLELWRDGLPSTPRSLCVGTRFHFHLLAARAGASGHAVVLSEYYRAKHGSLRPITRWSMGDLDGFRGVDVLDRVTAGRDDTGRTARCETASITRAAQIDELVQVALLPRRDVG